MNLAMDPTVAESLLELAEQASAGATGPDAKGSLEQLDARLPELQAAMTTFVDAGRTDETLRLANALYRFWITKQRFDEGAAWFDRALAAPGGDDRLRGKAILNAGFMPFWAGDDGRAADLFGRALEVGRRLDDPPLISGALGGLARVALRTDVAEGRRLAGEALAVSKSAGDEPGRSNALHLLGVGAQIAGDLTEAREWMTKRLALVRGTGNEFLVASEAANLSMVERQLGNLETAETLAREALVIGERIGDEFTKPFVFSGLAAIATERRQSERAAILLGAAEAIMEAQHMAWPPDERPHYERLLADLPTVMGSAEFEGARGRGHSMAGGEAVDFALGRHGPGGTAPADATDLPARPGLSGSPCYTPAPVASFAALPFAQPAASAVHHPRNRRVNVLDEIVQDQLRTDLPELATGDTVKVSAKVVEGNRERIQVFEGTIMRLRGGGITRSITVRRIASGVGVERTFKINSPRIEKIEVLRHGQVRRAQLYFLRKRVGKAATLRERRG
jgi:ribosomal protein L19